MIRCSGVNFLPNFGRVHGNYSLPSPFLPSPLFLSPSLTPIAHPHPLSAGARGIIALDFFYFTHARSVQVHFDTKITPWFTWFSVC